MTRGQYIDRLLTLYRPVAVLSQKNDCQVLRLRNQKSGKDLVLRSFPKRLDAYEVLCGIRCENLPEVYDAIDMPYGYNRPTGMMPIYPVISGIESFSHRGSFKNLLGTDEPTDEQLIEISIERQVDERAVPAFIMHTSNDEIVNIKNSLALATAYANTGKQFELHVYPDAPHGVGLGNRLTSHGRACWENAEIAKWVGQAVAWAESICEKQKESV